MQDRIEKSVTLNAPISRVWDAITDYRQFSAWFGVNLESPFVAGQASSGNITTPGYEHMRLAAHVKTIEPRSHFAFAWNPVNEGGEEDRSRQTLVEFRLREVEAGTELVISESGFAAMPNRSLAEEAYRRNSGGWEIQSQNIANYVQN
jgi:uncharacterized protein YndB with AHSA1/START domain